MGAATESRRALADWDYTIFSASEMTAITEMPQALQRAWRNRGQLPGGRGRRATFDTLEVAEILVRYQLSLNGVAPSESASIGGEAAKVILYLALLSYDGACEVRGAFDDITAFLERFEVDADVAKEIAGNPESGSFLWRGNGGKLSLVWDVAHEIEEKRFVSNFFIDLQVAALFFVERAGRPLVTVRLSQQKDGQSVRRLSRGRDCDSA